MPSRRRSTRSPSATAESWTRCSGSAWEAASRSRPPASRSTGLLRCSATSPIASRAALPRAGRGVVTGTAELVTTVLDVVHNEVDVAIVDASIEAHMLDHLIYGTHPGSRAAGRRASHGRSPGGHVWPAMSSVSSALPHRSVGDEVRFADAAGYTMVKTRGSTDWDAVHRGPPLDGSSNSSASSVTTISSRACRRPGGHAYEAELTDRRRGRGRPCRRPQSSDAQRRLDDICIASRTLSNARRSSPASSAKATGGRLESVALAALDALDVAATSG